MSQDQDRYPGWREIQAKQGVPMELPEAVKEPCKECPWRRESAPGWLGPQTAEEWIQAVHGEAPIMCHKTCNEDATYDDTRQCRGAAMFRLHVAKSPKRSDMAVGPEDKENVFATNDEFLAHHLQNADVNGWSTGDEVRVLVDKEDGMVEEGEEGTIVLQYVGSPLYGNGHLGIFFLPEGADEPLVELDTFEFEEV